LRQPNPIKEALRQGEIVIGTMIIQARTPAFIQLFAQFGLQYVFLDMEHGPYNLETAADLILTARLAGITPFVRVGETQYTLYSRLLDAGAQGIMTPRVESVEQVKTILRYTKYPPRGERGFSRLAAQVDFCDIQVPPFVEWANENLLTIIQIESQQAAENIEALISIPGVDIVVLGMDDLSMSLGIPGDTKHPLAEAALEHVVSACQARNIPWGLHIPDVERLEKWIQRGMQFCTFSADIWMFQDVLRASVPRLRRAAQARLPGGS
jgi:2-dehydro-3-deoxyglucarate aldolase/4-hydroxy-2-oxoheptanedioate aldolase